MDGNLSSISSNLFIHLCQRDRVRFGTCYFPMSTRVPQRAAMPGPKMRLLKPSAWPDLNYYYYSQVEIREKKEKPSALRFPVQIKQQLVLWLIASVSPIGLTHDRSSSSRIRDRSLCLKYLCGVSIQSGPRGTREMATKTPSDSLIRC